MAAYVASRPNDSNKNFSTCSMDKFKDTINTLENVKQSSKYYVFNSIQVILQDPLRQCLLDKSDLKDLQLRSPLNIGLDEFDILDNNDIPDTQDQSALFAR